jgi:hypothetical protein
MPNVPHIFYSPLPDSLKTGSCVGLSRQLFAEYLPAGSAA